MARYIDADKLVESLRADYDREGEKADTYAVNGDVDLAVKYSHGQFCYLNAMERVKDAPTADVAPKFEIERGDNGIDHCPLCGSYSITAEGMDRLRMAHKEPGQHGDPVGEQGDSAIDVAKLEVAREIFEEIEGSIAVHAFTSKSEDYADGMYDAIEWVDSKIAELKKKYTEGQK